MKMTMAYRKQLTDITLVAVLVAAVTHTALAIRSDFFVSSPPGVRELVTPDVPNWREYSKDGYRVGGSDAPVTIVSFADYQCPACKLANPFLRGVTAHFPGQVAVIYRHYPITGVHPHAREAALAVECAGTQGQFLSMHSLIYAVQDSIGSLPWSGLANRAGVPDSDEFAECLQMQSESLLSRIEADLAAGRRLGVRATPTILINDVMVQGFPGNDLLTGLVRDALTR